MKNPAHIRTIFGENLRLLSRDYPSVTALSQNLGINRTQFNRYLYGESFPRPDILERICNFFHVDARILLEPLARHSAKNRP
jgi:transcriptional regulator with XRE-family HTH domain